MFPLHWRWHYFDFATIQPCFLHSIRHCMMSMTHCCCSQDLTQASMGAVSVVIQINSLEPKQHCTHSFVHHLVHSKIGHRHERKKVVFCVNCNRKKQKMFFISFDHRFSQFILSLLQKQNASALFTFTSFKSFINLNFCTNN